MVRLIPKTTILVSRSIIDKQMKGESKGSPKFSLFSLPLEEFHFFAYNLAEQEIG